MKKILIRLNIKCWRIKKLSCFSKDGIEIRLKDIADVQDAKNSWKNLA
jgi:hypothetical protein